MVQCYRWIFSLSIIWSLCVSTSGTCVHICIKDVSYEQWRMTRSLFTMWDTQFSTQNYEVTYLPIQKARGCKSNIPELDVLLPFVMLAQHTASRWYICDFHISHWISRQRFIARFFGFHERRKVVEASKIPRRSNHSSVIEGRTESNSDVNDVLESIQVEFTSIP